MVYEQIECKILNRCTCTSLHKCVTAGEVPEGQILQPAQLLYSWSSRDALISDSFNVSFSSKKNPKLRTKTLPQVCTSYGHVGGMEEGPWVCAPLVPEGQDKSSKTSSTGVQEIP